MASTMSTVLLPDSIFHAAEVQARASGLTVEQWISRAVASHLGTDEAARAFFRHRAADVRPNDIREIFDALPNVPPIPGDEL